jgi:hypothetical protein
MWQLLLVSLVLYAVLWWSKRPPDPVAVPIRMRPLNGPRRTGGR